MQPDPGSVKRWYQKWWVWVIIAVVALTAIGLATGSSGSEDAATETTIAGETTEAAETTTTVSEETTIPDETSTTLPAILAEGEGQGDDVIKLEIPAVPVVVELTHDGTSNFAVTSLDDSFESIDLLVNEIGPYEGTRGMQLSEDEIVTGLEIMADGNWTYEIRPVAQEPVLSCPVNGRGDDIIVLSNFKDSGRPADLTHDGESNFSIVTYGGFLPDLIVNEIGPYDGTVKVSAEPFVWDITADGAWSIDC